MASILRARGLGRLANRSHTHTHSLYTEITTDKTHSLQKAVKPDSFSCAQQKKKKKQLRLFDTLPLGQT